MGLDDRKKAFENKFFRDEEMKFKLQSRARKLLGLWAAGQVRMSEEQSLAYALEIVKSGIEGSDGAVVSKIYSDLKAKKLSVSEDVIRTKLEDLKSEAAKQLESEYQG